MGKRRGRCPAEVRERAVRLVQTSQDDHPSEWAAIESVSEKIGCAAETLRKWVRRAERDVSIAGSWDHPGAGFAAPWDHRICSLKGPPAGDEPEVFRPMGPVDLQPEGTTLRAPSAR